MNTTLLIRLLTFLVFSWVWWRSWQLYVLRRDHLITKDEFTATKSTESLGQYATKTDTANLLARSDATSKYVLTTDLSDYPKPLIVQTGTETFSSITAATTELRVVAFQAPFVNLPSVHYSVYAFNDKYVGGWHAFRCNLKNVTNADMTFEVGTWRVGNIDRIVLVWVAISS